MIVHKFSVKPKVSIGNLSGDNVYPVLYVCHENAFDYYVVRGDDGSAVNIRYGDVTIEDVEL